MATKTLFAGESAQISYIIANQGNASGSCWVGSTLSINGNEIDLEPQYISLNPDESIQGRFSTPALTMTGNYSVICALWKTKPIKGITPASDRILDSGWIGNAIQVIPQVISEPKARFVGGTTSVRYYPSYGYVEGVARIKNTGDVAYTFQVGFSGTLNINDPWSGPFIHATAQDITLSPGQEQRVIMRIYPTQGGKYKFTMAVWDARAIGGPKELDRFWYDVNVG